MGGGPCLVLGGEDSIYIYIVYICLYIINIHQQQLASTTCLVGWVRSARLHRCQYHHWIERQRWGWGWVPAIWVYLKMGYGIITLQIAILNHFDRDKMIG